MLHETIRNVDFKSNTAWQCWNNVATIPNNIATMLQRRVAACAKNRGCEFEWTFEFSTGQKFVLLTFWLSLCCRCLDIVNFLLSAKCTTCCYFLPILNQPQGVAKQWVQGEGGNGGEKNREVCWDVAMRILYISGLSVSQLEIWNSEVSIVYNVDKFFSELTQVRLLAGYCYFWIVLILFNFQTVSFSAGVPVTSIIEMAISYNYEYLAMFTDTGLLWIGSADLQVGITLSHCSARKFSYQRTSSSS